MFQLCIYQELTRMRHTTTVILIMVWQWYCLTFLHCAHSFCSYMHANGVHLVPLLFLLTLLKDILNIRYCVQPGMTKLFPPKHLHGRYHRKAWAKSSEWIWAKSPEWTWAKSPSFGRPTQHFCSKTTVNIKISGMALLERTSYQFGVSLKWSLQTRLTKFTLS